MQCQIHILTNCHDPGNRDILWGWDDKAGPVNRRAFVSSSPSGTETYPKVNFFSLGSDRGSFILNSKLYGREVNCSQFLW